MGGRPEPFAPEIASRYLKGKPSEGCHHGWKNDLERVYPFQSFRCAGEAASGGQGRADSVSPSSQA
jgi:hypothetical protein